MAAVKVTINGVICDMYGRTISGPVKIVGEAMYTDLGVGGGPMPPGQGGGSEPPGIWGGAGEGFPTPPIYLPPGMGGGGKPPTIWPSPGRPEHPIYLPPGIWPNPPEGQAPHPEHPIVIPPPEGVPPDAPPLQVKVVWTPATGWQVVLLPTGAHPSPSR